MDIKKDFGLRIKELRSKKGITQYKLAEMVKIDPKHMSHIECGHSFPKADLIEKFALALEIDYQEFFQTKHYKDKKILADEIIARTKQATENELKMIYKFISNFIDG